MLSAFFISVLSYIIGRSHGSRKSNTTVSNEVFYDDRASFYIGDMISIVKRYLPDFKIDMDVSDQLKYGRFINKSDIKGKASALDIPEPKDVFFLEGDRAN